MLLALGLRDFDQIVVAETRRFLQDRCGDADLVMPGKVAHDGRRRLGDRRQLRTDLGKRHARADIGDRLQLDRLDKTREHVVEQLNLFAIETASGCQEEIGDAPSRLEAFRGRAGAYRGFDFVNNRVPSGRHCSSGAVGCLF